MNSFNLFAIFVGGGFGSVLRYGLSRWVYMNYSSSFPYGTMLVNVLSCLMLGFLIGYFGEKVMINPTSKVMLTVGFCGGFSTFSAFAYETVELLKVGQYASASANIVLSVVVCMASIVVGLLLSKLA